MSPGHDEMAEPGTALDPDDVTLVRGRYGLGLLGVFNRSGLLAPADLHTAVRLDELGGGGDELVMLAVALAVRAPRVGHVSVDLGTVRSVAAADVAEDVDLGSLPWPDVDTWLERATASPLVAVGEDDADRPLRLIGRSLYLDRYWRDELAVADDLRARAGADPPAVDADVLQASLGRLFARQADDDQRRAAATAALRRLTVIAGGPGTGKTTTVARLLAVLFEQAAASGQRPPLVALAAPTGKAAARLEEAVRAEAALLDVSPEVGGRLTAIAGSTLHRLLGSRPGTARFRHHRGHRLPHDVLVVDEASMISLGLMARLVESVRPDSRIVLVGDPEQLVSVEAGAVLADIVGPAAERHPVVSPVAGGSPMAGSIAVLRTNHRFHGALADLASAVRDGDADAAVAVLAAGGPTVTWLPDDPGTTPGPLRPGITGWAESLVGAARSGDHRGALEELARHRVICAHRLGPAGTAQWNDQVERWLADSWPGLAGEGAWYAGRPVLVTVNDYSLRLFNGDSGVTVARDDDPATGVSVAFEEGAGRCRLISPSRLAGVQTVYAMTVHKSQGSEFERITLLLPPPTSRLLTRELLYTAVTRARRSLVVAGTEAAVRAAVTRPVARASGLTDRLWRGNSAPPAGSPRG